MNAPIALFAFNRPHHLDRTLSALAENHGATLHAVIAFSDGPRNQADLPKILQTRKVLADWQAKRLFHSFTIIERNRNSGLAKSVITGVTELCRTHGQVIVLEDDLITSPYFLEYMRNGLAMYANDSRVASLHGYAFPMHVHLPETYFLAGADCWGWGTWQRSWQHFESNGARLLSELRQRKACYRFDVDGSYPYTRMLKRQLQGQNNSWAIRWRASAFLADMVSLHPARSLVANIGLDGSGTHCPESDAFTTTLSGTPITLTPQPPVESNAARLALARYFRSIAGPRGRMRCAVADLSESLQHLLPWFNRSKAAQTEKDAPK
jgi:hypothetical protein